MEYFCKSKYIKVLLRRMIKKSPRSKKHQKKEVCEAFRHTNFDLQCDKISQTPIINEGWRVGTSQLWCIM